jgi:hypothetical protein
VEYECLSQAQIVKLFLLTIFKSCWVGYERWRLLGGWVGEGGEGRLKGGRREKRRCVLEWVVKMVGLEAGNVGGKRWRPVHPVYSYNTNMR